MTKEQMRIVIAEACGAKWIYNPKAQTPHRMLKMPDSYISHSGDWSEWDGKSDIPTRPEYSVNLTPNYPEDLNACHEMEKVLSDDNSLHGLVSYCNILMRICGSHRACVAATPLQRCEAFIKTVCPERWVD